MSVVGRSRSRLLGGQPEDLYNRAMIARTSSLRWGPAAMWIASALFGCSGTGAAGGAGAGGTGSIFETTGPSGGPAGGECKNVDLLFVIDNSASMGDNQESLISSFPGFVSTIQKSLGGADSYHIGVVTTDDYIYNAEGCTSLGDLVTETGGVESSNATCGPFGGARRYMDETDADLAGKFACAAKVGVSGSDDERVAKALISALDPAKNGPGGCNVGFSRLDSLLVVVIITDEDDVPKIIDNCDPNKPPIECQNLGSGGTPTEWFDQVVALKGGHPENVVVLSLIGSTSNGTCEAEFAKRLFAFTSHFLDNGFIGDICAASYDDFFAASLPIVDKACQTYVEPK